MYLSKLLLLQRSITQLSYRLSTSHTFPNEDLVYTVKSTNGHIRSALYPLSAADYPKQVLPDLHLIKIFRDIELLKESCEQRNIVLDINQLASDYQRWQMHKKEYRRLRDLYQIQEKLRAERKQTNDLTMTDINETDINKTKKRKKKIQSNSNTLNETISKKPTENLETDDELAMISSVDNAWIESIAKSSTLTNDSIYARGEAIMNDNEFNSLKQHFEQFRREFRLFDQRFIVACLHLPAAQHIGVPAKSSNSIIIYESPIPIVKHAFNSKSWHELCHVEKNDVSKFGPYWLGKAPLHKHELVRSICTDLIRLGFQEMSSISMAKPFIYEALGANINESCHVLTTFESSDDPRSRSLITSGLGSLASLLVPFVRRTFLQTDLPYYVFTQGATYDVEHEQTYKIQLLTMTNIRDTHLKNFADPLLDKELTDLQLNSSNESIEREHEYNLHLKNSLLSKNPFRFKQTSSLDEIFIELTRLMYNLYEKFRLPFRIINVPSDKLRSYESMRLDYELFLPSSNSYVCVGSISLIGDYLSRRLMIRHKKVKDDKNGNIKEKFTLKDDLPRETKYNYVQLIYVQVVDVDMLTKCYVEKEQKELFNHCQQHLIKKQKLFEIEREDTHNSINQTFNKIFEQLIEIRRFCRNDIETQTLNVQIELQQMLDAIQYIRTKSLMYHGNTSETYDLFSIELEQCNERLSKIVLSPARDLDNLLSYLTESLSSIPSHYLPETPLSPISNQIIKRKSNISSSTITIDSGKNSDHSFNNSIAVLNVKNLSNFKFGPSIILAYPCDMIASNGRSILSYVIEKNFLNYSTVSGVNLSNIKVYRLLAPITANNARLWDIAWCPWSKFYLIVGNLGLYSLCYPYDTNPYTNEHFPQVNKLINFRGLSFQHVRILSHLNGWYIYMVEHQSVSIDLYDRRSGQRLRHYDNHIQHDLIPLGFHGFCLSKKLFAIVKKTEVLSTINNPHQIENVQNIQIYFFDLETMLCIQQMPLYNCSNVYDIKCCYEENIFMILAEPMQLILINLDTNELISKKLLDEGKHLCIINDHAVFILRSECSIQTLQYRNNK
ncbi:unnamed protein product [Rotaria sordida]|uniref:Uncharacterized protein n=1 Tax=Rotaria sordida TaxID=392033 RepID=A0A813Q511_9BILA|nr:unnamed protein product [Rotaria sordida]CAF3612420.1 unnamed protein product [Rotaria sordida]